MCPKEERPLRAMIKQVVKETADQPGAPRPPRLCGPMFTLIFRSPMAPLLIWPRYLTFWCPRFHPELQTMKLSFCLRGDVKYLWRSGQAARLFFGSEHADWTFVNWFVRCYLLYYRGLLFILRPAKETLFDGLLCCVQISLSALDTLDNGL